ncbi:hypothetical protein L2E82_03047 [Cichorium intybus]|uniref:Uncharacterized protein n=1 Tax=Cichorium intybus TaxID=13427 RepID=A0ACB9H375_CICIN|nr:hypothetical protein L2E82_03047 [Cichorium intybus]
MVCCSLDDLLSDHSMVPSSLSFCNYRHHTRCPIVEQGLEWKGMKPKEPLSWLVGSEVLVVDPPRKGLDPSLISALQAIISAEHKAMTPESPTFKAKDEKRPWILRAREDSIEIPSRTIQEENRTLPQTLSFGMDVEIPMASVII